MQQSVRPLLVIGHKNPDTDSVCSAVAYARLKAEHLGEPAIPCRAGNLNRQTSFVFSRFDVEVPLLLIDVYPRIADIMVRGNPLILLKETDSLQNARASILERGFSFLPVEDGSGRFAGRITALRLAAVLDDLMGLDAGREIVVLLEELAAAVDGRLLVPSPTGPLVRGTLSVSLKAGGVCVLPNHAGLLERALEGSPRLLVSCGGGTPERSVLDAAGAAGCALLATPRDAAHVVGRLLLLQPVAAFLDREPELFLEHELVRTARQKMAKSNEGGFIVVDEERRLRGVITRINLLEQNRLRLVLVDHNELAQAVDGAEEADLVEIIDHHRIGVRATDGPITFINRVVGSTSTIVAELYRSHGVTPEPRLAGIMLAAVLSDTLILRSPTTTEADRAIAAWLAGTAGVDVDRFGEEMFAAGSALEGVEPEALLAQDRKIYEESGLRFAVSQIEVVGFGRFDAVRQELAACLEAQVRVEKLGLGCLMVTDLTHESSLLLCAGERKIVDAITYPKVGDGLYEMRGVLSRKKQVLPYLLELVRSVS